MLLTLTIGCSEDYVYMETGINDISAKTEMLCPVQSESNLVLMTFGQSNSANTGQTLHRSKENVYNFYQSNCYKAEDPLLGASDNSGSVWSRLGDEFADNYNYVTISSFGVGGSSIKSWTPEGSNHEILLEAIADLKGSNIEPSYILWHQGETDVVFNTSTQDYYDRFLSIRNTIREHNITAPILVARATLCMERLTEANYRILDAQNKLINDFNDIKAGANTDLLGFETRYDKCHFNALGLMLHANGWKDAILEVEGL